MDNILLNGGLLGSAGNMDQGGGSGGTSGMFIFNGYNLHNGTTKRVINSNHDDLGSVAFETYNYPRADGGNALSKYYRKKTIKITISLVAPDRNGLEELIDELKFSTSKMQGFLDIIIAGNVRRRTATLTSLQFGRKSYNVNRVGNVELTFECINPMSFDLADTSYTYSDINGAYSLEINYSGKVVAYPTIYLIVHSQSNLSTININVNGYSFTVNHEISDGEFLVIDGDSKLAKINGTSIVYSGPFPAFEPGINHIEITFNSGASVEYDLILFYKNYFL